MKILSLNQCYELIDEMGMLDHIVAHSFRVCQVAVYLADQLSTRNVNLNRDLVRTSALLHDITKTRSIKTGERHAETGAGILCRMGYPEVGRVVGQHVMLEDYCFSNAPDEAELVNYADKRVLHDQVVTLQDRLAYILDRYGKDAKRRQVIRSIWRKTEKLECKIFDSLKVTPVQLVDMEWNDEGIADYFVFRDGRTSACSPMARKPSAPV